MGDIRILNVVADNFLTIRHASISFENRGLTGVIGPNGSGKSALIVEAPCYGLFGISERYGNKRDLIVNRFVGKDCHIGVGLEVDGMKVEVNAYRKHHKFKDDVFLLIDGQDKRGNSNDQTWDKVIKILDMDYTAFTNAVVFGQSLSQYFSSLSDAFQKEIVERLLGITWIPQAYEIAKQDREQCLSDLTIVENSYTGKTLKLAEVNEELVGYNKKYEEFEEERSKKIVELESQFESLVDTSSLEKKMKSLENRKLDTEDKLKELDSDLRVVEKSISEVDAEIRILDKELSKIASKYRTVTGSQVGSVCEFCGREITEESATSYAQHLLNDSTTFEKEKVDFEVKVSELRSSKASLDSSSKIFEDKLTTYSSELNGLKKELDSDKIKNAKVEERNKSLRENIVSVKKGKNVYADLVEKVRDEINKLEVEIAEIKTSRNEFSETLEYHKFWEEGFSNRGLKSFIIESVIPLMNQYAGLYSSVLGGKYNISFSAQKQLKKGELREKFYVDVENRFGSQSYEGNSNGERRAIDSIVMFVLGDLAASRSNKKFSLLILDDVFEKLDEEISDSIITVLKMMIAGSEGLPQRESIFVLTHLEYFTSKFENRIYMERKHGETIYRE